MEKIGLPLGRLATLPFTYFNFAYWSAVRLSHTPPRPMLMPCSKSQRLALVRSAPPFRANSRIFSGVAKQSFRFNIVLQSASRKTNPPSFFRQHEIHQYAMTWLVQ